MRHHVTPVAGGVADREQDRPVPVARQLQRLVAPGPSLDRVVGMLLQIGAGGVAQPVVLMAHVISWK